MNEIPSSKKKKKKKNLKKFENAKKKNKKIKFMVIFRRDGLTIWWGCFLLVEGARGGRMYWCSAVIPPKDIRLVIKVESASHCKHSGSALTKYHWRGGNNGVGQDLVAPMVVVDIIGVCREPWCNTIYACFEGLI